MYHVLVKSEKIVHWVPNYFPYLHGGVVWAVDLLRRIWWPLRRNQCGLGRSDSRDANPTASTRWTSNTRPPPPKQKTKVTQGLHHQNNRQILGRPIPISKVPNTTTHFLFSSSLPLSSLSLSILLLFLSRFEISTLLFSERTKIVFLRHIFL